MRTDWNSAHLEFLRNQEQLKKSMEIYSATVSTSRLCSCHSPVILPRASAVKVGCGSHPSLRSHKAAPYFQIRSRDGKTHTLPEASAACV